MGQFNVDSLPKLCPKEIHLWWSCLPRFQPTANQWHSLDHAEQERALRFKRDCDRDRYVFTRGVLRTLVSSYTQIPAAELQFCYGGKGKPALEIGSIDDTLEFNVSHSRNFVLWGLCRQSIGVDVEFIQPETQAARIAKRYFTEREYEALKAQPLAQQQRFFFRLWTRKESCIKVTGDSLFEKIHQLEVPCSEREDLRWMPLAHNPLFVRDLSLHPDYCGAIASVSEDMMLSCFEFDGANGLTVSG